MRASLPLNTSLLILVALGGFAAGQVPRFVDCHQMLPPELGGLAKPAMADVDGDGDIDLISGRLFLNDGTAVFVEKSEGLPPGVPRGTSAAGDVDGDGDVDVLVVGNQAQALLLNDGTGNFSDASGQLPMVTGRFSDAILADFDGDGDLDAWVCNFRAQDYLYLNDGSGGFNLGTLPSLSDPSLAVVVADVEGDGDLDVILGNGEREVCDPYFCEYYPVRDRLFLNDGSANFSLSSAFPVIFDATSTVCVADFDGDGDSDVVTTGSGGLFAGAVARLYLNSGGGFTESPGAIALPPAPGLTAGLSDVAAADVDGDGDVDLLIDRPPGQMVLLNDGSAMFSPAALATCFAAAEIAALADPFALSVGDLDGDGDVDVITQSSQFAYGARVFLNDGTGTLACAEGKLPADDDATRAVDVADVDGDGHPDLLFSNRPDGRIYRNLGSGRFEVMPDAFPVPTGSSQETEAAIFVDVDGDGAPDAFLGRLDDRLYVNDGTGSFRDATDQLPQDGSERTLAVVAGDVDGDGDQDLVLGTAEWGGSQDLLYLNDGAGNFMSAVGQLPTVIDTTRCLALGDVDADGDLDLLAGSGGLGSSSPVTLRLYLNDGLGFFSDASSMIPMFVDPVDFVDFGDVNGDDALDAIVGSGSGIVLINDSIGCYSDLPGAFPSGAEVNPVALGDVDEDGDLDLVHATTDSNRLYLNDGLGFFTEATGGLEPVEEGTRAEAAAFADLDDDGDLDLLLANRMRQNRMLTNVTRQFTWRGPPRLGKRLDLDVYGQHGHAWFAFASCSTTSMPAPPFGTIRLSLTDLVPLGSGVFGPNGMATVSFDLPPDPGGAAGITLYGQAIMGSPTCDVRLTNLEILRLSDL